MAKQDSQPQNKLGLFGATSVGVGAIVGGGILALAGAAFSASGPAAVVAFALNGVIAMLTAFSFAEMASRFPESGGTYTFSKKVLSVDAAFSVGWIVWFASIVAGVLYALGFAHFFIVMMVDLTGDRLVDLAAGSATRPVVAILATMMVGGLLMVKKSGGGKWINLSKVAVFAVLVIAGLWAVYHQPIGDTRKVLKPFFSHGFGGLIQAMGYTFIALQGFDLIAAVGGEVRNPSKNIPRAMIASLVIALAIYLPMLFVVAAVGTVDGMPISEAASSNPEGIVAEAARNYMGAFGYWLVIVAGVLAMISALEANLFAASRIAYSMARDRTLPTFLSRLNGARNPQFAVVATAAVIGIIILLVPDVATAGAASSLIFLVTFGLAHWLCVLVRKRSGDNPPPFRTPLFPLVPVVGGTCCFGLALFQAIAIPAAGFIAGGWLLFGGVLFVWLFAGRARIRDATTSAIDPELIRLRGRTPLVLVPIANPDSAKPLIALANSLVPRGIGRIVMQNIVVTPADWDVEQDPGPIERSQAVMKRLLTISANNDIRVEALTTFANQPMLEIARVARLHRCQSIVMGLSNISDEKSGLQLERFLSAIEADVVILRARKNWRLSEVRRILVPVAGRGGHEFLMARVLGSLSRHQDRQVTYVRVVPPGTDPLEIRRNVREMRELAEDQLVPCADIRVVQQVDAAAAVADMAKDFELIVLGATRLGRREKIIGSFTRQIASQTDCPLIVLNNHDH